MLLASLVRLTSAALLVVFPAVTSAHDSMETVPLPSWWMAPEPPRNSGRKCVVELLGDIKDDVSQILKAFHRCNYGGMAVFLEGRVYHIAQKFNPVLHDVTIE